MLSILIITIGIVSFICGVITTAAINPDIFGENSKFILPIFAATASSLAGAYFGAKKANDLAMSHLETKEDRERKLSLNRALFVLLRKYNAMKSYKELLLPLEDDSSRAFKVKPWQTNNYKDLLIDTSSLEFLLEDGEPDILFRALIEQERFEQALSAIEIRNKFQVETIDPILQEKGIGDCKIPLPVAIDKLGEHNFKGLVQGTDEVYKHVYNTCDSLKAMLRELHTYSKEKYPKVKFVCFTDET